MRCQGTLRLDLVTSLQHGVRNLLEPYSKRFLDGSALCTVHLICLRYGSKLLPCQGSTEFDRALPFREETPGNNHFP